MALHTGAHDGDLGAALVHGDVTAADAAGGILQRGDSALSIAQRDGEAHILHTVTAGGLQNDIHVDIFLRQQAENLKGHTRHIGNILHRQNSNVGVLCDTLDEHTFHFGLLLNNGAGHRIDAGDNLQLDIVLFGQLNTAVVQHLRTQRGQLQHFIEGDFLQLGGLGDLARVSRVDALHIGENLAAVGVQGGSQCHGGGIAAAAAQRGDIVRTVQPLKACHNHHAVAGQLTLDTLGVQPLDTRLGVGAVGVEAGLPARQADGGDTQLLQGHRQQGNRDFLARGQQHIHLAVGRIGCDFRRLGNQVIGGVALRRDNHNHIIACVAGVHDDARHVEDAVPVLDRGAAEFLYNQAHLNYSLSPVSTYHCADIVSQQTMHGKMLQRALRCKGRLGAGKELGIVLVHHGHNGRPCA